MAVNQILCYIKGETSYNINVDIYVDMIQIQLVTDMFKPGPLGSSVAVGNTESIIISFIISLTLLHSTESHVCGRTTSQLN